MGTVCHSSGDAICIHIYRNVTQFPAKTGQEIVECFFANCKTHHNITYKWEGEGATHLVVSRCVVIRAIKGDAPNYLTKNPNATDV